MTEPSEEEFRRRQIEEPFISPFAVRQIEEAKALTIKIIDDGHYRVAGLPHYDKPKIQAIIQQFLDEHDAKLWQVANEMANYIRKKHNMGRQVRANKRLEILTSFGALKKEMGR